MDRVIVAFEKDSSRQRVSEMLESGGITVHSKCRSGAETIRVTEKLRGGVVICGFKFQDMSADFLSECLKENVYLLLLANAQQLRFVNDRFVKLPFPVSKSELISTARALMQLELRTFRESSAQRTSGDKAVIQSAKELVMDSLSMSEDEAYRYIQKRSMDSGMRMVEVARIVLSECK